MVLIYISRSKQFPLSRPELEQMLSASDEVTKKAYSRMSQASGSQGWSRHTQDEVEFIRQYCRVGPGDSILDFGCDRGRHTIALAEAGLKTVGVDYVESAIEEARWQAKLQPVVELIVGDVRNIDLGNTFDAAICLYDVVGSYTEHEQNALILENLQRHLRPGGRALISVMNFDLTRSQCKNWFSIFSEPDKLLTLQPSNTMESTGNIFNPSFYLLDRETKIVYRKEQFSAGDSLPCELILRDKRFTKEEIEGLCRGAGLEVLWSRFVRAGSWRNHLARDDHRAKEILVLCEKPGLPQPVLFQ
jgi:2-polyprenyl-3-methyl-5-hydroxy-6-metoxy-1,4-benzoquinol methylase